MVVLYEQADELKDLGVKIIKKNNAATDYKTLCCQRNKITFVI